MSKRYRIKNKFRFTVFALVCILIISFAAISLLGYSDALGMEEREYVSIEVASGDTLWSIAGQYGPSGADIRNTVSEIKKINGISSSSIYAGQILIVPVSL